MDYTDYRRMIKLAENVETASYQVNAGAVDRTVVTLDRVTSLDIDGEVEIEWVVTDLAANPPRYVIHTQDEAIAHITYGNEILRVRREQAERTMYRR